MQLAVSLTMPTTQLNRNWLIRNKLYHIPFWCIYHFTWWSIAIGNPLKAAGILLFSASIIKFSFYVVFQAIAVYFNLYFLIPRYLEKSRFALYILFLLITIAGTSLLITPGYYLSASFFDKTFAQTYGSFYNCLGEAIPSTIASITLAMSIKLTKNWLQTERRKQLLEKEKLETELKFLKHQFNPHFLFNSINSIFFLIHKNPDMASASLAKFSELLRHQLYECNDHQIPLHKEISYLENFIELEKLRHNTQIETNIHLETFYTDQLGIAPFILMTFVENAFKHVSAHAAKPNWISIKLTQHQQQLDLYIANSTSEYTGNDVVKYGGIGLNNVKRRLDLLYAGAYELDIKNEGEKFEVRLKLSLEMLQFSPAMQMTSI
ncbi:sensor histidine kinase [Pedobacter sp. L105]|uniref:sensor histidine kinase n=1 Tax=Pedobacter sp. L105 TaxID=1641871 RepID=UPI001C207896|nr:histidine kinase [Pedobacter sp. L105]